MAVIGKEAWGPWLVVVTSVCLNWAMGGCLGVSLFFYSFMPRSF